MDIAEKIDTYILDEGSGAGKTPFKELSPFPIKNNKSGKEQYFIKIENPDTGEMADGYILTNNISMIHKVVGSKGWIITKHYKK